MSAESPIRPRNQNGSNGPNTVSPQPVTDPTILDSVAGIINEIVPTTYSDAYDSKDQIQWARFENLDCDESSFTPYHTCDKFVPAPLILVLGYTTGVQVWAVPANGDATEIFSWRHGSVKALKILPTPYLVEKSNDVDAFATKRPLVALCDSVLPGSTNNSLSFYSLRSGEQVKLIKFKTPICDILANKKLLVVAFSEKIAIFDAFTLEDKLSVTTCYLSPGLQPNPVALGPRWLAYAEKKLNQSRRSSGGNEGEGVQSYTATVLHAAKSLGRGLRELGETVASSLTGNQNFKPGTSPNSPQAGGQNDIPQKGIVTVLDIESPSIKNSIQSDAIIAHFAAHNEAIVALQFDPCGLLLLTADKRGHDFHLFRIHPHPGGSGLAAVHHLYTLHRGDTSARVQDMCFSFDSRWVTVSTLRGTTHVFPITPYGGNIGVRTHATPHVVNKMSRFHRSAGLTAEGRSNSPVSMFEAPVSSKFPFHNPRFPPFPHPTVMQALAQIRQPVYIQNMGNSAPRTVGRQRLSSSSEENIALRVVARFAPARAWIDTPPATRETTIAKQTKSVESLFVMSCHGTLVQYDLEPRHAVNIPKEKVCDDTPIELSVTAKAQWVLQRQQDSVDVPLPLSPKSINYVARDVPIYRKTKVDQNDDDWLSQVEIVTHAGPHRRLWMGPQFTFKTYTTSNGACLTFSSPMSLADAQPIDLSRSKPVNMPITKANAVLIESSSASSNEQSLLDTYHRNCEEMGTAGEHQIKEDLADAMIESPSIKETGGRCVIVSMKPQRTPSVAKVVNPLGTVVTVQSDDESEVTQPEDTEIHENCDEALFRPIAAPKSMLCQNVKSKQYSGNIMTKSLEGTTEVAVKILKKPQESEGKRETIKKPVEDISNNVKITSETTNKPSKPKNGTTNTKKRESKLKIDVSDPIVDAPQPKHTKTPKSDTIKPLAEVENIHIETTLPVIDNEDFFSLETISKPEKFEDAEDCGLPPLDAFPILNETKYKPIGDKSKLKNDSLEASSELCEENTTEEKSFSRKQRKPRSKLGVKIATINKENSLDKSNEKSFECPTEITTPKCTWSTITATQSEKALIDLNESEKDPEFDLELSSTLENFAITIPEANGSDLIDMDTPSEERRVESDDNDLLKIDKSSDDEKGSPVETTESDDSGKIPEVEVCVVSKSAATQGSKTAKRKVKKKKK